MKVAIMGAGAMKPYSGLIGKVDVTFVDVWKISIKAIKEKA